MAAGSGYPQIRGNLKGMRLEVLAASLSTAGKGSGDVTRWNLSEGIRPQGWGKPPAHTRLRFAVSSISLRFPFALAKSFTFSEHVRKSQLNLDDLTLATQLRIKGCKHLQ